VNATVTAMPGTARLVSVAEIDRDQRLENLAWLASRVMERPGIWPVPLIADQLALYADPAKTPQRQMSDWVEYLARRHEEADAHEWCVKVSDETRRHHKSSVAIAAANSAVALAELAGVDS
jgi:hypothetical protein